MPKVGSRTGDGVLLDSARVIGRRYGSVAPVCKLCKDFFAFQVRKRQGKIPRHSNRRSPRDPRSEKRWLLCLNLAKMQPELVGRRRESRHATSVASEAEVPIDGHHVCVICYSLDHELPPAAAAVVTGTTPASHSGVQPPLLPPQPPQQLQPQLSHAGGRLPHALDGGVPDGSTAAGSRPFTAVQQPATAPTAGAVPPWAVGSMGLGATMGSMSSSMAPLYAPGHLAAHSHLAAAGAPPPGVPHSHTMLQPPITSLPFSLQSPHDTSAAQRMPMFQGIPNFLAFSPPSQPSGPPPGWPYSHAVGWGPAAAAAASAAVAAPLPQPSPLQFPLTSQLPTQPPIPGPAMAMQHPFLNMSFHSAPAVAAAVAAYTPQPAVPDHHHPHHLHSSHPHSSPPAFMTVPHPSSSLLSQIRSQPTTAGFAAPAADIPFASVPSSSTPSSFYYGTR